MHQRSGCAEYLCSEGFEILIASAKAVNDCPIFCWHGGNFWIGPCARFIRLRWCWGAPGTGPPRWSCATLLWQALSSRGWKRTDYSSVLSALSIFWTTWSIFHINAAIRWLHSGYSWLKALLLRTHFSQFNVGARQIQLWSLCTLERIIFYRTW